ncbi:MAG: VOC family protein [Anaerolineales bacterium]|nr:VOC family protein [Anaerolineales bacterium]
MRLNGLHHVTAVTAQIEKNLDFYSRVLGLRLVKKTVNQDDTSAYHLFYADKSGTPGTDITFFDWPHISPNQRGTDSIAGTAFRVSGADALPFWTERLKEQGTKEIKRTSFAGRDLISFQDPEGQHLYLVDDEWAPFEGEIWPRPEIPDPFALRGFYSVILSVPDQETLAHTLETILHFVKLEETTWMDGTTPVTIYRTRDGGGPGSEVWVLEEPYAPRAKLGAGGVHHTAFRVKDQSKLEEWHTRLVNSEVRVTRVIDRFWFKSIYFRVSRGILFEIATEGPGFAIDEDMNSLGEKLVLPSFLESQREEIESKLTPIEV